MVIIFSKLSPIVAIVLLFIIIINTFIINKNTYDHRDSTSYSNRELLSSDVQITDGQPIKTYNGIIPLSKCPAGSYRPAGGSNLVLISGQLNDGCIKCPRGRYGTLVGSSNPLCDAPCPSGRFGKKLGLKAVSECELCPPGKYGAMVGVQQFDSCPTGKYNPEYAKTSIKDCIQCPVGYRGWQCIWPVSVNEPNKQN